ncbi:hypothetical protein D9757_011962 [Collybiopsis confluens]|uniref:Uncharacterized protein n=1 Tax=Collybiopsis confluens TaxID=2823264 RepID=A0A8H5GGQ4_9AGAR|nr:hypothetical protein D9757_011962 [Collybiopsis confluens]
MVLNFPSHIAVPVQYFLAPFILALAAFVFIIRQTGHGAPPPSHTEAAVPTISDIANGTKQALPSKQNISPGKDGVKTQKSTKELSQNLEKAHLETENASITDAQPEVQQEGNAIVVSAPSVLEGSRGFGLRGALVEPGAFMAVSGDMFIGYGHSQGASRIPLNALLIRNPSVLRNADDIIIDRDTEVHEGAFTAVSGNAYLSKLHGERPGDLALQRNEEGLPTIPSLRRL